MTEFDIRILTSIVQLVAVLTPIGIIVWKISRLTHTIEQHTKDIEILHTRIGSTRDNVQEMVAELNATMNNVNVRLEHMSTALEFIQKDLTALKDRRRET